MFYGYNEASIARRAAKRGQTVDEHLDYLREHQATRHERRREARKAKTPVIDTPTKA